MSSQENTSRQSTPGASSSTRARIDEARKRIDQLKEEKELELLLSEHDSLEQELAEIRSRRRFLHWPLTQSPSFLLERRSTSPVAQGPSTQAIDSSTPAVSMVGGPRMSPSHAPSGILPLPSSSTQWREPFQWCLSCIDCLAEEPMNRCVTTPQSPGGKCIRCTHKNVPCEPVSFLFSQRLDKQAKSSY